MINPIGKLDNFLLRVSLVAKLENSINLFFREYGRGEPTLVILHGLLGSSQNWQSAARILGAKCRVLVVDQRNHGSSPHTATHTFADLRDDIERFLDRQGLYKTYLLGHSMGGLAAMEFSFYHPERLTGLIIADIAPRAYRSSSGDILRTLNGIDLTTVTSREQVEAMLALKVNSSHLRKFLLTNLVRRDNKSFAWKVNLPVLQNFERELSAYEPPLTAIYSGPTLFLGGELSDYRLDRDHDIILRHFPNSHLVMIPSAGHWIHFEALEAFTQAVMRFIFSR
ncbi:MAG: alpha/beta fold hydrolase [candidate division KSB1 bacterium]|nr:alpha/beta fold hydrolase [candidate division KSB1 bacterium]MDZ7303122.1 alpha/beta fold hydrolase [candidate division KSB1 bacterium]MDZ7310103.1 alpha/beta fold hydrolase [candidate division KSB1 bacterium]